MSVNNPSPKPFHTAPLRALVAELHQGRTVAENVVRLRYRRRKGAPAAATVLAIDGGCSTAAEAVACMERLMVELGSWKESTP